MNQTFSFQRWSLLVAKHWAENRKRYLLSLAAMAGLMFMWFVFIMMTDKQDPMAKGLQQVTYFFPLFAVGAFYSSQFFKDMHSRTKGVNYLLVPASALEKLLCALFYGLVLFFVVFTLLFYIVDVLAVAAGNILHPYYGGSGAGVNKATVANVFDLDTEQNVGYYFILFFVAVQASALLGSAYFSNYHFIKTAIVFCLLALFIFVLESAVLNHLLPRGGFNQNMHTYRFFTDDNKSWQITLASWIGDSFSVLFKYAFPPLFWVVTYYRLKEKEV